MKDEQSDRFWAWYWALAAAGFAFCVGLALFLMFSRPALSVETLPLPEQGQTEQLQFIEEQ
jgi:hypothetical protein